MAIVIYVKTIDQGQEPDRKAISIVSVDGQEIQVSWWPSLMPQWGKDGVMAYLKAEALFVTGNYVDALNVLQPIATGTDTRELNGLVIDGEDTRNWAQRWIDEHPIPAPVEPVIDPFL